MRATAPEARARATARIWCAAEWRVHSRPSWPSATLLEARDRRTAALIFLPPKPSYAELHARLRGALRAGFDARGLDSCTPHTCMATTQHHAGGDEGRADARTGGRATPRALPRSCTSDVGLIEERAASWRTQYSAGRRGCGRALLTSRRHGAGHNGEWWTTFDVEELAPEGSHRAWCPQTPVEVPPSGGTILPRSIAIRPPPRPRRADSAAPGA